MRELLLLILALFLSLSIPPTAITLGSLAGLLRIDFPSFPDGAVTIIPLSCILCRVCFIPAESSTFVPILIQITSTPCLTTQSKALSHDLPLPYLSDNILAWYNSTSGENPNVLPTIKLEVVVP